MLTHKLPTSACYRWQRARTEIALTRPHVIFSHLMFVLKQESTREGHATLPSSRCGRLELYLLT